MNEGTLCVMRVSAVLLGFVNDSTVCLLAYSYFKRTSQSEVLSNIFHTIKVIER